MGSRWADFESPFMSTNAVGLTSEQRGNRETLVTLMGKAGFMSYPGEWWHYSYGDREWAAYQGLKEAFYGRAEDPYK
jgi:D-alanyl-D-alanine dipeptidase